MKTILDYLRVINQPDNNDALARIINTPSRRIGEVTIKGLLEEADQMKITLWALILGIAQGKRKATTTLSKQTTHNLSGFANIILMARKQSADSDKRMTIVELIDFVLKKVAYENWLEEHHNDVTKARWANVQELVTQAADFQDLISRGYEDESLPEIDGLEQNEDKDHLSRFLANVALASEVKKNDDEGSPTAQVTISTIHAAKGLEWPVVFIPATYQGSIPHSRAEDTDEERRLLYVAMTRAKALLYLSYPLKSSQGEQTILSPFLLATSVTPLLDQHGPPFQSSTVLSISQILGRNLPSASSISKFSESLKSREDDLFPINGENEDIYDNGKWTSKAGNPTFTMGQRAPKRQRIELGRSTSNIKEGLKSDWKPQYATTMDRASSFTSATVTIKAGFVSAGSHLQALTEQSVNCIVESRQTEDEPLKSKATAKSTAKALEGQSTLMSFLGKSESRPLKRIASTTNEPECAKDPTNFSQATIAGRNINQLRPISSNYEPICISPSLANHRLAAGQASIRPRTGIPVEQHKRNDYVFLSSSPPRPKTITSEVEPVAEKSFTSLTTKPPLLPLIRPAITMHTTSIPMAQNLNGTKKTLGVKRSMNGWANRKSQGFVPPTMKRPG